MESRKIGFPSSFNKTCRFLSKRGINISMYTLCVSIYSTIFPNHNCKSESIAISRAQGACREKLGQAFGAESGALLRKMATRRGIVKKQHWKQRDGGRGTKKESRRGGRGCYLRATHSRDLIYRKNFDFNHRGS